MASILECLVTVPEDVDVSLVIRHAEREEIAAGTFGHDVNLDRTGSPGCGTLGRSPIGEEND